VRYANPASHHARVPRNAVLFVKNLLGVFWYILGGCGLVHSAGHGRCETFDERQCTRKSLLFCSVRIYWAFPGSLILRGMAGPLSGAWRMRGREGLCTKKNCIIL
jgi:hypothetical protein